MDEIGTRLVIIKENSSSEIYLGNCEKAIVLSNYIITTRMDENNNTILSAYNLAGALLTELDLHQSASIISTNFKDKAYITANVSNDCMLILDNENFELAYITINGEKSEYFDLFEIVGDEILIRENIAEENGIVSFADIS